MKAAVCYEIGKPLVIEDVDIISAGAGQVKVKVAATAICHSDIHDIKGELPGATPFIGGHETAGYIAEIGEGVTSVKVGDPVVVSLLSSCGHCYYCITGMPHQCENWAPMSKEARIKNKKGQSIAPKGGVGGFAEYVIVGSSQVVKVPDDMPLDRACLLACGVSTGFGGVVKRAEVGYFNSVVVIGTGGVGLNAIQGASYAGAYPIIAVDILDNKLKAARDFGATHAINSATEKDLAAAVKKLTSNRGAEFVFVTVGSVAAIKQGWSLLAPRGMTVIIGLPNFKDTISFSPMEFIRPEKMLTGGFMGSANIQVDIPRLITLYQNKKLKLDELVTGRYPLEKINDAIASTEKGEALRNVIIFK